MLKPLLSVQGKFLLGYIYCTVVQFGIILFDFLIDQCVVDCSCTNQKRGNRVVKRTLTFISVGHVGGNYFYPKRVTLH